MVPNARWQFVLLYTAPVEAKLRAVDDITAALVEGAIGVGPEHGLPLIHHPLADTAAAHTDVENSVTGKVLIDVTD